VEIRSERTKARVAEEKKDVFVWITHAPGGGQRRRGHPVSYLRYNTVLSGIQGTVRRNIGRLALAGGGVTQEKSDDRSDLAYAWNENALRQPYE